MSENTPSPRVPPPAHTAGDDRMPGSAASTPAALCEHPVYLKSLRSLLSDSCRAFEERRSHAITAIEDALASLASDQSLPRAERGRLIRSFEQQLARVRALEAAIPETQRKALTVLDQLEARAGSRRTGQT